MCLSRKTKHRIAPLSLAKRCGPHVLLCVIPELRHRIHSASETKLTLPAGIFRLLSFPQGQRWLTNGAPGIGPNGRVVSMAGKSFSLSDLLQQAERRSGNSNHSGKGIKSPRKCSTKN
ncbi:hypothetical protein BHM03_00044809 [Ensete ventricosum]|uniref:Uncharacterized protein n=1 Tax=Ensete ventricosum TaxID=4639 RepID=A0A445MKR6_ENSVE|nr:hypothetical protein BHM03_00044809 [Ensete ventricosum]